MLYTRNEIKAPPELGKRTCSGPTNVLDDIANVVNSFPVGLTSAGVFWLSFFSLPINNPRIGIVEYPLSAFLLPISLAPLILVTLRSRTRGAFLAGGLVGALAVIVFYVFVAIISSALNEI